jgi:hypothetical protein
MRGVQTAYSRWFNRGRLRDGPLFRGRFRNAVVQSLAHRSAVVSYIDRNPVDARVVATPSAYPHGSAARHCRARGLRWMERSVVAGIVADRGGAVGAGGDAYDRAILGCSATALDEIIGQRLLDAPADGERPRDDPLDDLVRAATPHVQAWMEHKATLADATAAGVAVLSGSTVVGLVDSFRAGTSGTMSVRLTERSRPAADLLAAGLLRTVCGLRYEEIARRARCGAATAKRRVVEHVDALRTDRRYAAVAGEIVTAGLRADFPPPVRDFELTRDVAVGDASIRAR